MAAAAGVAALVVGKPGSVCRPYNLRSFDGLRRGGECSSTAGAAAGPAAARPRARPPPVRAGLWPGPLAAAVVGGIGRAIPRPGERDDRRAGGAAVPRRQEEEQAKEAQPVAPPPPTAKPKRKPPPLGLPLGYHGLRDNTSREIEACDVEVQAMCMVFDSPKTMGCEPAFTREL
eukprot:jgi/Chlat1/6637/Chrsp49S06141